MDKKHPPQSAIAAGNWPLVILAGIIIVLNAALLVLAIVFAGQFGWWALLLGFGAVSSIILAISSIKYNEPIWVAFDLMFPK